MKLIDDMAATISMHIGDRDLIKITFILTDTGLKNKNIILDVLYQYIKIIKENYTSNITVAGLSKNCNCSESYINHLFKKRTGSTIKTYVNFERISEAKRLLSDTKISLTEISNRLGFSDSSYFSKVFASLIRCTPSEYRRENS